MNATHPNAQPFIDSLTNRQISYQRCLACDPLQSLARSQCSHCHSARLDWQISAGNGLVDAVSVVARAPTAAFKELVPYALVLVSMAEGHRIMGHGEPGLQIGDPVTATFFEHGSRTLIRFTHS